MYFLSKFLSKIQVYPWHSLTSVFCLKTIKFVWPALFLVFRCSFVSMTTVPSMVWWQPSFITQGLGALGHLMTLTLPSLTWISTQAMRGPKDCSQSPLEDKHQEEIKTSLAAAQAPATEPEWMVNGSTGTGTKRILSKHRASSERVGMGKSEAHCYRQELRDPLGTGHSPWKAGCVTPAAIPGVVPMWCLLQDGTEILPQSQDARWGWMISTWSFKEFRFGWDEAEFSSWHMMHMGKIMNTFVVYFLSWLLKYGRLSLYSKGQCVYQISATEFKAAF